MTKLYYLRGALGNKELLTEHEQAIYALLTGTHASSDLEKLKGHAIYSFRLNQKARLLFCLREMNSQSYLVLLDYLPEHEYHKSRFLRAGVLRDYLEKHSAAQEHLTQNDVIFEPLSAEQQLITQALVQKTPQTNDLECIALDYYPKFVNIRPATLLTSTTR